MMMDVDCFIILIRIMEFFYLDDVIDSFGTTITKNSNFDSIVIDH